MRHTLRITVSKAPRDGGIVGGIVGCSRVKVREKLMSYLLGKERRLMVIVPGNSVRSLSIVEEGGECNEQNEAVT